MSRRGDDQCNRIDATHQGSPGKPFERGSRDHQSVGCDEQSPYVWYQRTRPVSHNDQPEHLANAKTGHGFSRVHRERTWHERDTTPREVERRLRRCFVWIHFVSQGSFTRIVARLVGKFPVPVGSRR